jgi:hypothetical protein
MTEGGTQPRETENEEKRRQVVARIRKEAGRDQMCGVGGWRESSAEAVVWLERWRSA